MGYATTFCDLAKHKIFDVVEGRSEKGLEGYLNTLEGKDKVQAIDLSSSYRKLIRRYFPNNDCCRSFSCDSFIESILFADLSAD